MDGCVRLNPHVKLLFFMLLTSNCGRNVQKKSSILQLGKCFRWKNNTGFVSFKKRKGSNSLKMDGWNDGWNDEWMDIWIDGWTDGSMD